ncbi:hypothetical protein [Roseomonas indoligenes]|uniref:Uncharacterized protein n=1 Tax=Roseomonas indoligenes TaxID=2820811 RepID=A0A940N3C8_9PROT|nr:hypothetical protein [Pararoseomonas indoligenes]MBP0495962.1 hypothetical protein [Pararoseomonas indoligenes]
MPDPAPPEDLKVARQVLPSAATMIGICTTLVGLVKIMENQSGADSRADELGGMLSAIFLASVILSYAAIRLAGLRTGLSQWLERGADLLFVVGLLGIAGLTLLFAYDQI